MKSKASEVYESISLASSSIITTCMSAYAVIIVYLLWSRVTGDWGRIETLALDIAMLVSPLLICVLIPKVVKKNKINKWKLDHKKLWVEGLWLSIHVKENIMIGTVEIVQEFDLIKATGENTSPKGYGTDDITSWEYDLGIVKDDTGFCYIGCYSAIKGADQTVYKGIHMLKMTRNKEEGGDVLQMDGFFGDAVRDNNDAEKIRDKHGQLYLFKMSPECKEYLINKDGGIDYDKLRELHENKSYEKEAYTIKLIEQLEKLEKQREENSKA